MCEKRSIRIFLSSPGDVEEERKVARKVIECLKIDPFVNPLIYIEVVAWDNGSGYPLTANYTPQEAINRGLPLPSECDIVVVILWCRMGTPLPYPDYQKPDGTRFHSGTEWEFLNAFDQVNKSNDLPEILVYRCKKNFYLDPLDPKFHETVQQIQLVKEFFATFRTADGAWKNGYLEYEYPADFGKQLGDHLRKIIDIILKKEKLSLEDRLKNGEAVQPEPKWKGTPFLGLQAFKTKHAPIFFGRERETDDLIERLKQNRFVAVVGASGSGKSSLVWAGVVPRVVARYQILRFTPGEDEYNENPNPFVSLAYAINAILKAQLEETIDNLPQCLQANPKQLDDICQEILSEGKTEVLLFIDQFEELFTLVKQPNLRDQFVNMLVTVQKAQYFRILLTMRGEFYAQCLNWSELSCLLQNGTYPLSSPGQATLNDMITKPAKIAGLELEQELRNEILNSARKNSYILPLIAYTLEQLYNKAQKQNSSLLTFSDYEALGNIEGAISKRAEEAFKKLDKPAQEALPEVFSKLVTVNEEGIATRKRAPLVQVKSSPESIALVQALTNIGLLVTNIGLLVTNVGLLVTDEEFVEVAHETIFSSWQQLNDWIEKTSDDLLVLRKMEEAVYTWKENGKNEEFLWNGDRLKKAISSIERLHHELSEDQEEFLTPEIKHLEAKLRNNQLTHPERESIGQRMYFISDTRPGVGLREIDDNLPDIFWCKVPGGRIQLEDTSSEFEVEDFYIAKYVVTCKQFQVFLSDHEGYRNNQWWTNFPERQESEEAVQPFPNDNYPRTNVNWFEAMAFCAWLTEKLPRYKLPEERESNWVIRLPTEWEWQQAASGGSTHIDYPWGNWSEEQIYCNDARSGLARPTAVGMYPQGSSSIGALDMLGNVFEWCLNNYQNPQEITPSSDARRSIRGGSWIERVRPQSVNLKYREYESPVKQEKNLGFRVLYAPSRA